MLFAVVAVATLLACEIALRLPLGRLVGTMRGSATKAVSVIRSSRISDDWKEKVLPAYARRILTASLAFFACLVAIALPVLALTALVTGSLGTASAALIRPLILVEMIAIGAGYLWLRSRTIA